MGAYINADLDKIYDTQEFPLNAKLAADELGRVFQYVKYNVGDGDVDGVVGYLCLGLDAAYPDGEVTCDYSSTTIPAIANDPRGFLQAALTDEKFGWIQTEGPSRQAMLTDGAVAQDEQLMKHATTDGGVDTLAGTAKCGAVAKEADTGTALAAGYADVKIDN